MLGVVPVGSMNQREAGGAMEELDLPELLPQPVSVWEYRGCEHQFLVRPMLLSLPAPPASSPARASLCQALTSSPSRCPEMASLLIRGNTGLCSSSKHCQGLPCALQVQAKKQG